MVVMWLFEQVYDVYKMLFPNCGSYYSKKNHEKFDFISFLRKSVSFQQIGRSLIPLEMTTDRMYMADVKVREEEGGVEEPRWYT